MHVLPLQLAITSQLSDHTHFIVMPDMLLVFQLPALIVLREAGVSVDLTTARFQQTAAHIAAFAGADHCLKYLVHFGCNVNKQVCNGSLI